MGNAKSGDTSKLIEIKNLEKYFIANKSAFGATKTYVKAVDDVSFYINKGETLGLVGESGCGKTTIGRTMLRLYEPTSGKIYFNGKNITTVNMKNYRKKMQIIFQDPFASLNPRMTVGDIVGEPIDIHNLANSKSERKDLIYKLLETVGLNAEHANRYPHEFSGGQRQRVGIARALAVQPEFIVCDEPISALDVSIQAQVVNMLEDLQEDLRLTYLFIAHDLSIVKHISNRVGVMYLGKLVELTSSAELYKNPLHPYTQALLSAIPVPDPEVSRSRERIILQGDVPSPINPPEGCRFRTRCPYAKDICTNEEPKLIDVGSGHMCACNFIK
jgi:oligopeptide transport system ATP-binding protein